VNELKKAMDRITRKSVEEDILRKRQREKEAAKLKKQMEELAQFDGNELYKANVLSAYNQGYRAGAAWGVKWMLRKWEAHNIAHLPGYLDQLTKDLQRSLTKDIVKELTGANGQADELIAKAKGLEDGLKVKQVLMDIVKGDYR